MKGHTHAKKNEKVNKSEPINLKLSKNDSKECGEIAEIIKSIGTAQFEVQYKNGDKNTVKLRGKFNSSKGATKRVKFNVGDVVVVFFKETIEQRCSSQQVQDLIKEGKWIPIDQQCDNVNVDSAVVKMANDIIISNIPSVIDDDLINRI
jgi:translation initiation factor IF-1